MAAQDPDRIFEAFRAVRRGDSPARGDHHGQVSRWRPSEPVAVDHPLTQAAARALEATFGKAPVYIREGGSIPVAASFATILGLPVVLLGITPPDENAHAPNEWMGLDNYETGIRTFARMFDELVDLPR